MPPPANAIRFLAAQRAFFDSRQRWAAFIGGIGSGKTFAGAVWAISRVIRDPNTAGLIAANTYRQLAQSTWPAFIQALYAAGFREGRHYVINKRSPFHQKARFLSHQGVVSFAHGAQIALRSLENYNALRGMTLGWAWLDETRDTAEAAFDVVAGRLRAKDARFHAGRITTTPGDGYDWLYRRFIEPGAPDFGVFRARTSENTYLPAGYYESLRGSMDPVLARRELDGEFVLITQGRAYPQFDRARDLAEIVVDNKYPLVLCCDFGVRPMAWVVCQEHDGITVVIDEIIVNDATTEMAAREFMRRYGSHPAEIQVYGDAAGRARSTKSHQSDYAILSSVMGAKKPRILAPSANPAIRERVNSVNARFCNALAERRLRIAPRCKTLIADLEQVAWRENDGQLDKGSENRLTHASDALGYYIVARWPIGRKLRVI